MIDKGFFWVDTIESYNLKLSFFCKLDAWERWDEFAYKDIKRILRKGDVLWFIATVYTFKEIQWITQRTLY